MTGLLNRIINYIGSKGVFCVNGKVMLERIIDNVTSNDSGLINLTSLGINPSNAFGITLICTTSNYKFSNPILWSNGDYYTVLTAWNNATPVVRKQVRMIVTWYHS